MRTLRAILLAAVRGWRADHGSFIAAGLTFYTLVSMAPLLMILLSLAGSFLGPARAESEVVRGLTPVVGPDAAAALHDLLRNAGLDPARWTARLVGVAIILFASTRIFSELQRAMRIIWSDGTGLSRKARFLDAVRMNLAAFVMVVGAVLLWLAGTVSITLISTVAAWMSDTLPGDFSPIRWFHHAASFFILTLSFALIYRLLPRTRVPWSDVWRGAALTAVLMIVGQKAIATVLAYTSIRSIYGAAGSVVLLLLWFFYSWMIFLLGAEFTKACGTVRLHTAERAGTGPEPNKSRA